MNEYRYYQDPYFEGMVWRFGPKAQVTSDKLNGLWLHSALSEFEDFTSEGIKPSSLGELPEWVRA